MKGGKEHRPSPLTAIGSSACAADVCYQVTSPLHKYLGGLGVEPPKEKEAKKERNLVKKKLEIKDGIYLFVQQLGDSMVDVFGSVVSMKAIDFKRK